MVYFVTKQKQLISTDIQITFLLSVIFASFIGLLGSAFITTYFRFQDNMNSDTAFDFIISLLGFGSIIIILFCLFKSRWNKFVEDNK